VSLSVQPKYIYITYFLLKIEENTQKELKFDKKTILLKMYFVKNSFLYITFATFRYLTNPYTGMMRHHRGICG
jgi:hypothetical protein